MNRATIELPVRGLQLLLIGAAAHEVECEGHVAAQDRGSETENPAALAQGLTRARILTGLLLSA
jgi:hypothetical protein